MKRTRQSGADRRLSLLHAALDLFSTQGYAGTTTAAIAERSGVTQAMLFRHFHSKEVLLTAVVEQFRPRPLFPQVPPTLHNLSVRSALHLLITRYLDSVWAHRDFMLMMFTTPKREQAVFAEMWHEFNEQGIQLYVLLDERTRGKEIQTGIAAVATDVIAAATSGYLQRLLNDAPTDWDTARDKCVSNLLNIIFSGIAAQPLAE